jgi:hypothetical protein
MKNTGLVQVIVRSVLRHLELQLPVPGGAIGAGLSRPFGSPIIGTNAGGRAGTALNHAKVFCILFVLTRR